MSTWGQWQCVPDWSLRSRWGWEWHFDMEELFSVDQIFQPNHHLIQVSPFIQTSHPTNLSNHSNQQDIWDMPQTHGRKEETPGVSFGKLIPQRWGVTVIIVIIIKTTFVFGITSRFRWWSLVLLLVFVINQYQSFSVSLNLWFVRVIL